MTARPLRQRNQETISKLLGDHIEAHKAKYPSHFDHMYEMSDAITETTVYDKGVENIGNLAAGIIGELGSKAIKGFVQKFRSTVGI